MFNKLKTVIVEQLKQGVTVQKLTQSVVIGILVGCFPLLGFTTLLAALFGFYLKLNQVVIQTTNYLMYPVQIILIPFYIKFGSLFVQTDKPISIRPDLLIEEFLVAPIAFLENFIWIGLVAILLWSVMSLILYFILIKSLLPLVSKVSLNK
ncbi:MAG: DUF2062 domain-containing protein [Pseudobdellovibrio sp.]